MHFKVELCFELAIHLSKVLISSPVIVQAATVGMEFSWRLGREGGRPVGCPSWVCRSEVSWAQRKPDLGLDFLPCYYPRLKGDLALLLDPSHAHSGRELQLLMGRLRNK